MPESQATRPLGHAAENGGFKEEVFAALEAAVKADVDAFLRRGKVNAGDFETLELTIHRRALDAANRVVGLDGTGVPVRPTETTGRRGKPPAAPPRPARSSWRRCGRPKGATPRAGLAATWGQSATTPPSRARAAATPTRSRPPSPNAPFARRIGAASSPSPDRSSSAMAPPGSGTWPTSNFPTPSKSSTEVAPVSWTSILSGRRGVRDAEDETAVRGGVPAADGRPGSGGANARGPGSRVRAVVPGDPDLGGPGRPRCRESQRRATHGGT